MSYDGFPNLPRVDGIWMDAPEGCQVRATRKGVEIQLPGDRGIVLVEPAIARVAAEAAAAAVALGLWAEDRKP